jgi:hypothetical protein
MSLWRCFHKGEKQNASHYSAYCKACVEHHKSDLETVELRRGEELDAAEQLATEERIFRDGTVNNFLKYFAMILIRGKACRLTVKTRGEKSAFVAHILGGRGVPACLYATEEAKSAAQSIRDERSEQATTQGAASAKRSPSAIFNPGDSETSSKRQKLVVPVQSKIKAYNSFEMPFSRGEIAAIEAQTLRATIDANLPFRAFENEEVLKLLGMLRKSAPAIIPS